MVVDDVIDQYSIVVVLRLIQQTVLNNNFLFGFKGRQELKPIKRERIINEIPNNPW